MSSKPAWPYTFGENAESVRLRYCPRALRVTLPSLVPPASRDTASTTNLGRRLTTGLLGSGSVVSCLRLNSALVTGFSVCSATCSWKCSPPRHSKNWSLALRSTSGVLSSPTMQTVVPRSQSLRHQCPASSACRAIWLEERAWQILFVLSCSRCASTSA